MTRATAVRRPTDELDEPVREVTSRVADRLIDAVERDAGAERPVGDTPLAVDERRQQLLVGAWINDEITVVNEDRLRTGRRPLDLDAEQALRSRVVAELTGAGPLEPYLNDTAGRGDRHQLGELHVGHLRRRTQGRHRGTLELDRRTHGVPEAARTPDARHR